MDGNISGSTMNGNKCHDFSWMPRQFNFQEHYFRSFVKYCTEQIDSIKYILLWLFEASRILTFEHMFNQATEFCLDKFNTSIVERNIVPDFILRAGIRFFLQKRLNGLPLPESNGHEVLLKYKRDFIQELKKSPIAIKTDRANQQHYEIPTEYYDLVLGPRKKYSASFYPSFTETLTQAENEAFKQVCERAEINDLIQNVVDLGCGWGSMTLYLLETYPKINVTAISNSKTQRTYIMKVAESKGWINRLTVYTQNVAAENFTILQDNFYDRVISIEMMEHMKNYEKLLYRVSKCLKSSGKLFVHIFTHRSTPYHFEDSGNASDWMSRYFFSGGTMPSADLFHYFQRDLSLEAQWCVNGKHYSRTLESWLQLQDKNQTQVHQLFKECYGSVEAKVQTQNDRNCELNSNIDIDSIATKWVVRWRIFYLACSELFAFNDGEEWFVSHYLFVKQ